MLEVFSDPTAQFLWYSLSNARGVRDLEAVESVMSKIGKKRGLVVPLIETTLHAQRLILVLVYRSHEATHYLQSLDGLVGTFW